LLSGNLADYLIPTATDFPKIRAIALENHRSPSNPLGVKGAGEGAIIPIGGLMANAVANALASFGAMPNQLPVSPARVWQMRKSRSAKCTFTAITRRVLQKHPQQGWRGPIPK
jgi:carbon-monoxide dehydrogenase large subunit